MTVDEADVDVLTAHASQVGRAPATVASQLLRERIQRLRDGDQEEDGRQLAAAQREIGQLRSTVDGLRKRLREQNDGDRKVLQGPRWEWPIADLLEDRGWWDRWLPRLYELLGRDLIEPGDTRYGGRRPTPILDDRGYADVLTMLFPPLRDGNGRLLADWRSPRYAELVANGLPDEGTPGATIPYVWEPVIRHVAEALSALEETSVPGADAMLRMRAKADISYGWLIQLRALIGDAAPEALPRARAKTPATK